MKRKLFSAMVIGLFALAGSLAVFAGDAKPFQKTVTLNSGGMLRLDTYKGSITISSWDRDEIAIDAHIEAPEDVDADYGQAAVDATRIEVSGEGDSVTIRSDYDDVPSQKTWLGLGTSKVLPYVHYHLQVPRRLNLKIKDYKSDIDVAGLEGRIAIETYKGQMKGQDLSGELSIETYKGDGTFTALRGSLDVETYKGTLSLTAIRIDGHSSLETYKGDITLIVPPDQPLNVREDIGRRGTFSDDSARVKDSGPTLRINTYKGTIRLK